MNEYIEFQAALNAIESGNWHNIPDDTQNEWLILLASYCRKLESLLIQSKPATGQYRKNP